MVNKLSRFFRRVFLRGGPQAGVPPQQLPPQQWPSAGPSAPPNIPRGGPGITSVEVPPRQIPQMPTEPIPLEFRPTSRVDRGIQVGPGASELRDQGVQVGPGASGLRDQGAQVGPELIEQVDQGVQVGPELIEQGGNPIPIGYRNPPPRRVPIFIGGGSQPPRKGSGRPFGGGGGGGFDPSEWMLLIIGLITSLALYQFFLRKIQAKVTQALDRLEEEKNKASPEADADAEEGRLAFWRMKGWFRRGAEEGWIFLGSILAGRRFFLRAVNLIFMPPLRRLVGAVVPPIVLRVANPVVGIAAQVGVRALSPIARFISFIVGLDVLLKLGLVFANPQVAEALEFVFGPVSRAVQNFFSTPKGVTFAHGFLERGIKVVSVSLLFGGFYTQFLLFFEKDGASALTGRQKVRSLVFCVICGVSMFFILNDHRFIVIFVQNFFKTYPAVEQRLQQPLSQTCLLFASGFLIQSVGFPPVVLFFYAWTLYCSGLHFYFLNPRIPVLSRYSKNLK